MQRQRPSVDARSARRSPARSARANARRSRSPGARTTSASDRTSAVARSRGRPRTVAAARCSRGRSATGGACRPDSGGEGRRCLTGYGATATPTRATSRSRGRVAPERTAAARAQCDVPSSSSPPTPVSSVPPRAISRSGAWKCALNGQRSPWRSRIPLASGPTQSSSWRSSSRTQSVRPRCSTTSSCHSASDDRACIGKDVRDRDRRRQSFAARDGRGRRQHRGRIAAAREADEAGAPCECRENCSSERVDRVALDVIGRPSRPGFAAEHETGGELERAQLERGAAERHEVPTRAAPSGPARGGTPRPGA